MENQNDSYNAQQQSTEQNLPAAEQQKTVRDQEQPTQTSGYYTGSNEQQPQQPQFPNQPYAQNYMPSGQQNPYMYQQPQGFQGQNAGAYTPQNQGYVGQIPQSALGGKAKKPKTAWISKLHTGPFIALMAGVSLVAGFLGGLAGAAIMGSTNSGTPSQTQMYPGMMRQSGSGSGSSSGADSGSSSSSGSGSSSSSNSGLAGMSSEELQELLEQMQGGASTGEGSRASGNTGSGSASGSGSAGNRSESGSGTESRYNSGTTIRIVLNDSHGNSYLAA